MLQYFDSIRKIIENNPSAYAVVVFNREGTVEYCMSRYAEHLSLDSITKYLVGKSIYGLYENLNESTSSVITTLRTGKVTYNENQRLRHKNFTLVISSVVYPVFDKNGGVAAAVEVAHKCEFETRPKITEESTGYPYIDGIVTANPIINNIKERLPDFAESSAPVLIYGETGTGKQLIAEALHYSGSRKTAPFVSQNCAAVPESLIESTFFGTEKGSFTGAESKKGIFEQADGGTLFLDEINSVDVPFQAKLLKAMEEGKIRRVGGTEDIPVNVRIICASNEHPADLIRQKKMREDFYYRTSVIYIELPPLRERPGDVSLLADRFISVFNVRFGKNIVGLSPMVSDIFRNWNWPGNVRELKNTIERAFFLETTPYITLASVPTLLERVQASEGGSGDTEPEERGGAERASSGVLLSGNRDINLQDEMNRVEKEIIEYYIANNRYLRDVAGKLGISPQALQYKIKKLKIEL